ncbi:hypothetical protein KJ680_07680 [bacterium]|nr:hypothetical protein [bacterium]
MSLKKEIINYIESTTSWQIKDADFKVVLPLHIKRRYELWKASIAGKNVLFVRGEEEDIRRYYKTVSLLEESTRVKTVLVFETLSPTDKERFIKQHISFVVKDKYIYMPFALMQIESENMTLLTKKLKQLTPLADTILLGYLVGKVESELMISQIATLLNQGIREVSNALAILEQYSFVRIEKQGRKKLVFFESQEEAFDYFVKQYYMPVKATFFTNSQIEDEEIIYSSFSALSQHSTLVDNGLPTVAIYGKNRLLLDKLDECFEENAEYKVEVWDRDPSIFSVNKTVNPLYLLRFFDNSDDERIGYALDNIEKKIKG